MSVEERSAEQKDAKLIFARLYLILKFTFRIFNSVAVYSLSFISHVILFSGQSQSFIRHFSKI